MIELGTRVGHWLFALLPVFPGAAIAQREAPVVGMAAWSMSPEYKAVQASALDMQRHLLLSMADSMPENLYRDKVTPVQRDFAQQLLHAAGEAHRIAAFAMGVAGDVALPDTATALASRAGLTEYINAVYDHLDQWLGSQTENSRNQVIDFFGTEVPRWLIWDEISSYTIWTAGQVVANFRKNGMAPPAFHFLPVR